MLSARLGQVFGLTPALSEPLEGLFLKSVKVEDEPPGWKTVKLPKQVYPSTISALTGDGVSRG